MLGSPKRTREVPLTHLEKARVPVLSVEGVRKAYGSSRAVDHLDLEVEAGEIVALIGPSGCGKTTSLRLVAGLERPDSGTILISGKDCRHLPPEKRSAGFVFQDYALFPHLTVAQNVGFGLRGASRQDRRARVGEILHLVGLSQDSWKNPGQLSGGQQQRVALARALAPTPALLLLDEPLSNLDPQLRRQVRHDVVSIIRAAGTAALWVTHDHDEGLIISDKVVVMKDGRVIQSGTPSEIWQTPRDAWVARFLGTGDLVPGTVRSGKVRTVLGNVDAGGWAEGASAQVLVRPEDVILDGTGHPGTVVRRHFSGKDSVYCVQLQNGPLLHCRQPPGVEISRGTLVQLRFASENLAIYA